METLFDLVRHQRDTHQRVKTSNVDAEMGMLARTGKLCEETPKRVGCACGARRALDLLIALSESESGTLVTTC